MSAGDAPAAEVTVLWRDESVVVVDKASGLLVHNSSFAGPRETSLRQLVGLAEGRSVYPVHRLDRGTSGVLLFATEREHVAPWQAALASPCTPKIYLALVRGSLEGLHEVDWPVKDAEGTARAARSTVLGIAASQVARISLVAARLHSGRHHQARRHLAHLRHPVIDDAAHGNSRFNREFREVFPLQRMALHCAAIDVRHPKTGLLHSLRAPISGTLREATGTLFDDSIASRALEAITRLCTHPLPE